MTNNDCCNECCEANNLPLCNGEMPLRLFLMRKRDYNHNMDCVHIGGYAFTSPPPGACVFSPEDYEDYDDADTHISDYIGEV